MARNNTGIPPYPSKPHSTGQARITIKRKDFYLGPFGSEKSIQKYAQVIAQIFPDGPPPVAKGAVVSVEDLIAQFMGFANQRYVKNGKPTSEIHAFKCALSPALDFYGDDAANDFGPLALAACRDELNRRVPLASFASVFVGEQSSTSLVPVDTWLLTRSSDSINGWLGAFPGVQHRVVPKVALDAVELK